MSVLVSIYKLLVKTGWTWVIELLVLKTWVMGHPVTGGRGGRVKSGSYLLKVLHSCHTYVPDIEKARVVKVVGHFTPTIVPHQISFISHPDGSQFVLFCVCSLNHCQLLLMLNWLLFVRCYFCLLLTRQALVSITIMIWFSKLRAVSAVGDSYHSTNIVRLCCEDNDQCSQSEILADVCRQSLWIICTPEDYASFLTFVAKIFLFLISIPLVAFKWPFVYWCDIKKLLTFFLNTMNKSGFLKINSN